MRHAKFGRKLSRDTNSRKALLINLTSDLILRGSIKTTLAKAKFVQSYAEKVITSAKKARLGRMRVIASSLTKGSFKKLMEEVAPGFEDRNGGYTRIIKHSPRNGDSAPMAKIELVAWDKSKTLLKSPKKEKVQKTNLKKEAKKKTPKESKIKKEAKTVKKVIKK